MATDEEVTAAADAMREQGPANTPMWDDWVWERFARVGLKAAEDARLNKIREQNTKAFEEFARPNVTYPQFVMPPSWGQLTREQREAMQEVFGGVTMAFTQKCYEEQLTKIREHNAALEAAWTPEEQSR